MARGVLRLRYLSRPPHVSPTAHTDQGDVSACLPGLGGEGAGDWGQIGFVSEETLEDGGQDPEGGWVFGLHSAGGSLGAAEEVGAEGRGA
jgi:hypothetical protein